MPFRHALRATLAIALATAATPVSAEWLKATSKHFIVYADSDRASLTRQASELERFDAVLRLFDARVRRLPRVEEDPDAEFNRVTVFVVPNVETVQRLSRREDAAGVYFPRITGSVAFVPRVGDGSGTGALNARVVLFHEYAHHFMFSRADKAFPAWYSEGFAEFASTVMERGGKVWLGAPANHRGFSLLRGQGVPIEQLLAPRQRSEEGDAFYGRGWLLTHMLSFDDARRPQLARYLALFNAGTPSVEAAREAFGDLRALNGQLDHYLERNTTPALPIEPSLLGTPVVEVRPLTPGERALVAMRATSTSGVDRAGATTLYARAKPAAAPFASDAVAQGWLAEMAFDAGKLDEAEAACDAAIAADPRSSQALLYKARVRLARAKAANANAAAWTEARGWIIKANRAQQNDAAALSLYYDSFGMEGRAPSPAAIAGLYRAIELAPQDRSVRFQAAQQLLIDGDAAQARLFLRALASDPHAGADNPAARLLTQLDAGKTGRDAISAAQAAGAKAKP